MSSDIFYNTDEMQAAFLQWLQALSPADLTLWHKKKNGIHSWLEDYDYPPTQENMNLLLITYATFIQPTLQTTMDSIKEAFDILFGGKKFGRQKD